MAEGKSDILLGRVSAPLVFYALALLIVEAATGFAVSALPEDRKWAGFLPQTGAAAGVEMGAPNWRETVKDPDEAKVFLALDDPAYTWRTASAIARQTGLAEAKVLEVLKKYSARFVRLSRQPSASGQPLVGLIEKVGA